LVFFHLLKLENITFCYPGTTRPALEHFNLRIPAGQITALVGENSAGKTTLIKLICRFYDPEEGRLLIDGTNSAQRHIPGGCGLRQRGRS
jgi:ATP-binding cassette subfamily B protein